MVRREVPNEAALNSRRYEWYTRPSAFRTRARGGMAMFSNMFKRGREDGQVSRQEYELSGENLSSPGLFPKASVEELKRRRIVNASSSHLDRRAEYHAQLTNLNRAFAQQCREAAKDPQNVRKPLEKREDEREKKGETH
eukprot:scaffold748_cov251-Pinguiococcus_pyrenoidosus.AAC.58